MDFQAIKGFKDLLPADSPLWGHIEATARDVFEAHGYREIRVPIAEYSNLFARSIGEVTDIVEKEMFTFEDRSGKSISLRPEGTAGVVRAYIEHGIYKSNPKSKLYYMGPMFRRERPQKGRLRQFHQMGAEAFGIQGALVDAELISMQAMLFEKLGVSGLDLAVNSLGCRVCRPTYRDKLVDFLKKVPEDALCKDCRRRRETNPMRVLDCKREDCKTAVEKAPTIFDDLCGDCKTHHDDLERYLKSYGVEFRIDPRLVRGLDYYTRTAFEFLSDKIGAQSAVSAGGRYDNLVEELGGPKMPGVGFAMGVERLAMLMPEGADEKKPDIFFAFPSEENKEKMLPLIRKLHNQGVGVEMEYEPRGLKGQMKQANKTGAAFSTVIGDEEISSGTIQLKNMAGGDSTPVDIKDDFDKAALKIKKIIKD